MGHPQNARSPWSVIFIEEEVDSQSAIVHSHRVRWLRGGQNQMCLLLAFARHQVTRASPHSCPGLRGGLGRAQCTLLGSPTAGVEAADSESGVGLNPEGAGGRHCADGAGARTQLFTSLSSSFPLKVVQAAVSFSLPFCFPPASRHEGEFPFPAVSKWT
ncbi:PREDICTED: uncharacterized protein LOC108520837 [Rhinopithecus bieti]|uniref:uncharacterized protein LOC108520837 n=1 Tax=Rhinopithecus bieti TaxID=61621 RepID=UPI00083C1AE2|nr:PREDICTED: uncharacterized protein LOC108520837 [Rhinopithecus bieti]